MLIIDDVHPILIERLEKAGFLVRYLPEIHPDNVSAQLADIDVLVVRSKIRVTDSLLKFPNSLKLIARAGSGTDNIEISEKHGIHLISAPEGNAQAVAEHTLMFILALVNKLKSADYSVGKFQWLREQHRGLELAELTVGIIGHGHVGSALAKLLQPFGCRILAYDKYKTGFEFGKTEACSYQQLMEHSDVISFHVPLTSETQSWINDSWFQSLGKPVFLVNTARGELLDLSALLNALESNHLAGVALDVLPNEKLSKIEGLERVSYEKLFQHPKVLLTPHVAGWTTASYKKISEVLAEKIISHFADTNIK